MNCEIPIQLATTRSYLVVLVPCLVVLLICIAVFWSGKLDTGIKRAAVVLVAVVNIVIGGSYFYQFSTLRVSITSNALIVRSGTSSVDVPLTSIKWGNVSDAANERFTYRKRGTSLPGFQVGWFVSEKGRRSYLLRSNAPAVLVPTTGDFDLVIPSSAFQEVLKCQHVGN